MEASVTSTAKAIGRIALSQEAKLSPAQIDYLMQLEIIAPDVGEIRKKFSLDEARIATICAALLPVCKSAKFLVAPIQWLRRTVAWPGDDYITNLAEAERFFNQEQVRGLSHAGLVQGTEAIESLQVYYDKNGFNIDVPSEQKLEPRWTKNQFEIAEYALMFEKACQDQADFFLMFYANPDSIEDWQTLISEKVRHLDGRATWVTINVRELMRGKNLGGK